MTDSLHFVVPGEPVPKGRARTRVVTTKSGKSFATHYTPADTKAYEAHVKLLCQVAANQARWLWTDKDRFTLTIRVYRTHEGAGGDWDNYAKAASDAINGIAFRDDRYIRAGSVTVMQDRARPRLEITVQRHRIGETKEASHG